MKKIAGLKNIGKGIALGLILPFLAAAMTINELLTAIKGTLNIILGLLFALVTVYFIWGVIVYVTAGGDEEKLARGKKHMLWGIIGMAVIAGVWGLVTMVVTYFGGPGTPISPPTF